MKESQRSYRAFRTTSLPRSLYECGGDISFDNCFLVEEIRVIKDTGGPV